MIRQKITALLFLGLGFHASAQQSDQIFHYSVMDAMRNAVYDGDFTIDQLKQKGDFGLGTYNFLDGELLALDGIYYRIVPDGKVVVAEGTRKSPFTAVAFFAADTSFKINGGQDMDGLLNQIKQSLASTNRPYAIRIECEWDSVSVGGAKKVAATETTGLSTLMKTRPIYSAEKVKGTLVGFYNPAYAGGIDLSPFHFHFISEDRKYGGHLVSGKLSAATITILLDEKTGYDLVLPKNSQRFNDAWQLKNAGKSTY